MFIITDENNLLWKINRKMPKIRDKMIDECLAGLCFCRGLQS